jgi:hypothetical protein
MSSESKESELPSIEWIQTPHHGPLVKPGLEGAACYGARTCIARPQREVFQSSAEFDQHLAASQKAVRDWLAQHKG